MEYSGPNTYNRLFIYPGDGAGGFGTRTEIVLPQSLSRESGSYYIKDFNGDNKLDLIVLISLNTLVYLNNGTGAFTPLPLNTSSGSLINVADVNNDSRKDLIVTVFGNVYYQLANADGTFGARVQFPQISYVGRFEGDFDGDGDMDFAAVDTSTSPRTFKVVYNQGNGTFTVGSQSVPLTNDLTLFDAIKDLNNDGKPDAIVSSYGTHPKVTILLNQGNGNFTKTDYAPELNRR